MSSKNAEPACTDPVKGELVAAYEMGLLEPADRTVFEKHLEMCEECQEKLFEMAPAAATLTSHAGAISAKLSLAEEGVPHAGIAPAESRRPHRPFWSQIIGQLQDLVERLARPRVLVPVGATVAIAVVLSVFLQPTTPGGFAELAQVEPVPYVQLSTRDVASSEAERLFREGMGAYADARYDAAARLLGQCTEAADKGEGWDQVDQARFYLGLSLLLSGDASRAVGHLEEASHSPIRPVADRSRWYLAQAALLQEDPETAVGHLQVLAGSSLGYARLAEAQLDAVRRAMAAQEDPER
jgi:hypothetical protein